MAIKRSNSSGSLELASLSFEATLESEVGKPPWIPILPGAPLLHIFCTMSKPNPVSVIPNERIERAILLIRGLKVMLDRDLAELYGVKPIALRQQVKRNRDRFPPDFIIRLSKKEAEVLVSQNVIPSRRSLGGALPYAFTQEGVAMLSSVLRSEQAVQVNIAIMRAFVRLREMLASHKDLASKLADLEKKYDEHFRVIFDAIRQLMAPRPPSEKKGRIGFRINPDD